MSRYPQPGPRLPRALTGIQQRVLRLRLARKMSFREIAAAMGWRNAMTAYQHYRYAVEKAKRLKEGSA